MDVEMSTTQPQVQQAGRGDRVARTREAIVSSTLTLAMEGEVAPIVRDIAKLAGVSARTVFQHFADTAELYVAVLGRVLTGLRGEAQPAPGGALDERIMAVIGQ
ncbi:MAG TPA: TetR/AcrR family transcriptional regulator, partial [Polyangia bacterium]